MLNPSFERFYNELLHPLRGSNANPQKPHPAPTSLSAEAKMALEAFEGPQSRPDIHNAEMRAQTRAMLAALWGKFASFIDYPHSQEETCIAGVGCRIIRPENVQNTSQKILYLHGGAYWVGSPKANASTSIKMAHLTGLEVVSIDYRLAPEHPHPAGCDDAIAVYKSLLEDGVSASSIAVYGDSAGGGLALTFVLALKEKSLPMPAALGLISPWTDLTMSGDSHITHDNYADPFLTVAGLSQAAEAYAAKAGTDAADISPYKADLTGLPPMIIHVGTREIFLSDATRLARQARLCGVEVILDVYEAMWHVWHAYPGIPEADQAMLEIAEFLCNHMD